MRTHPPSKNDLKKKFLINSQDSTSIEGDIGTVKPKHRKRNKSAVGFLDGWMLNILTSIWVPHTLNTGQNLNFQCFLCSKAEIMPKRKKFVAKLSKKWVCFWSAQHPNAGQNIQQSALS